ncbi:hypothetical protein F4859DRAFT_489374 [Xylaria cf. heliscus]|nr:hypothetical protein F4859DRAFT_489374 [Xylaria cf. heliscus]
MPPTNKGMIIIPRRRDGINKEAAANAMEVLGSVTFATDNEIDSWRWVGLNEMFK